MTAEILKLINQLSQALDDSGEMSTGEQIKNDATEDNMNYPLGENEDSRIQDHENRLADKIGDEVGNRVKEELKINRQATGLHSKTTNMLKDTNSILADVLKVNERVASLSQKNTNLLDRIEKYSKPAPRKIERFEKQQPTIKVQAPATTEAQRLTPKAKAKGDMDMMKMLLAGGVLAAILAKALKLPSIPDMMKGLFPKGFTLDDLSNILTGNIKDLKDEHLSIAKVTYKSAFLAAQVAAKAFYKSSGLSTLVKVGKNVVGKAAGTGIKALGSVLPTVRTGPTPGFNPGKGMNDVANLKSRTSLPDGVIKKNGTADMRKINAIGNLSKKQLGEVGERAVAKVAQDSLDLGQRVFNATGGDMNAARAAMNANLAAGLAEEQAKISRLGGSLSGAQGKVLNKGFERARKKAMAKITGRVGLRSLAKIPVIGNLTIGTWFTTERLARGDYTGAALEAASAGTAFMPVAGTGTGFAIDAGIIARDISRVDDELKKEQARVKKANVKYQEFMKEFLSGGTKDKDGRLMYTGDDFSVEFMRKFHDAYQGDASMQEKIAIQLADYNQIKSNTLSGPRKEQALAEKKAAMVKLLNDERQRLSDQQTHNMELAGELAEEYQGYLSEETIEDLRTNAFLAYNSMSDVMQSPEVRNQNMDGFIYELDAALEKSAIFGENSTMPNASEDDKNRAASRSLLEQMRNSSFGAGFFEQLGIKDPSDMSEENVAKVEAFRKKYFKRSWSMGLFDDNIGNASMSELREFANRAAQQGTASGVLRQLANESIAQQTTRYEINPDANQFNKLPKYKLKSEEDRIGIVMMDGKAYPIKTLIEQMNSGTGVSEEFLQELQKTRERAAAGDSAAQTLLESLQLSADADLRKVVFREQYEHMGDRNIDMQKEFGISKEDYLKLVQDLRAEGVVPGRSTQGKIFKRAFPRGGSPSITINEDGSVIKRTSPDDSNYSPGSGVQARFIRMLKSDVTKGMLSKNPEIGVQNGMNVGTMEDLFKHGEVQLADGKLIGARKPVAPGQLQFATPYTLEQSGTDPSVDMFGNKYTEEQQKWVAEQANKTRYYDSLIHPSVRDLNNNFGVAMDFKDPSKMTPAARKAEEARTKKIMDATIKLQELSEQTNKSVQQLVQEMREGSLAAPGGDTLVTGGNTAVTVNNSDGAAAINNSNNISKDSIYKPK